MGLGAVQYLRQLYPKSTIIYGVPQWIAPLYQKVKTEADEIYPLKLNSLSDYLNLYNDLIDRKVDVIYEMHQSGRGKKIFGFFAWLKGIPYFAHNHHLKSGTSVIDQGIIKSVIQRDLDGVCSFLGDRTKIPSYLDFEPHLKLNVPEKKKRIIFGVVATRETKKWPLEHFGKLAKLLLEKDPELSIVIPLSHSADDLVTKNKIERLNFPKQCQIVQIALADLPHYFTQSQCYIGNDTGLKHLAVSVGLPTYTLFGPEPPHEWHPYSALKHKYFYREGLECRTRTHHYCGLSHCDSMICLNEITPQMVFDSLS